MISKFDLIRTVPKFILRDRNGFAMARAIEAALKYFLEKSQEGLDTLQNVDKMPEWRLDEMAWEMNCLYDETAQEEVKREWIRNAIPLYSIWGTKTSIAEYLKGYFGEVEVQEFWEYSGDPFHFRVTVGGEWTPENEAWARRAIDRAKNVRSVLDAFRLGCRCYFAIEATGEIKDRFRFPCAGELWAGEYPTENIKWEIDKIPGPNYEVEDFDGRVAYEMAGERPEINHLLSLDNTPLQGDEAEEIVTTIYYPLCGDPICGE